MNNMLKYINSMGFNINNEQIKTFSKYYYLINENNKKINLTKIIEIDSFVIKHIIDSLLCFCNEIFKNNFSLIDIGTGAGFPGIPLKIFKNDLKVTLLDSSNKKIKFLCDTINELELHEINVLQGRAEDKAKNLMYREKFNIAISRAVAKLDILCELCLPFVTNGGYFIAMKGAHGMEEYLKASKIIKMLGGKIEKIKEIKLPISGDKRIIFYIKKYKYTPDKFPRHFGLLKSYKNIKI